MDEEVKIAAFSVMTNDNLDNDVLFFRYLAQAFTADMDFGFIDENITPHDIDAIKSGITGADIVLFIILFNEKSKTSLHRDIISVIKDFTESKKSIIVTNSDIDITTSDPTNLLLILQDTSEDSLASVIVKLSGKKLQE